MTLLLAILLAIPLPADNWLRVDVQGFRIFSNASAADTQRIANALAATSRAPVPTRVFIFRDAKAYAPVRDAIFQRAATESKGVFLAAEDENFILIQADAGLDPIRADIRKHLITASGAADPPEPASRAELLAALGHLFTRARKETFVDAEVFLTEALRLDPALPLAHLDLGLIDDALGLRSTSDAHYKKALEHADAEVTILYGAVLLARLRETQTKEDVAQARETFERAARLDPDSARALAGIGATYVVSPDDPAPGIAALEKSLALAPAQEDAAVNLTTLYARAGRRDDAQRIFDTVVAKSTNPDIIRLGRSALARLQQRADDASLLENQVKLVESAMAMENPSEALAVIDKVLPLIKDPEFKGSVERLRRDVAKKAGRP